MKTLVESILGNREDTMKQSKLSVLGAKFFDKFERNFKQGQAFNETEMRELYYHLENWTYTGGAMVIRSTRFIQSGKTYISISKLDDKRVYGFHFSIFKVNGASVDCVSTWSDFDELKVDNSGYNAMNALKGQIKRKSQFVVYEVQPELVEDCWNYLHK